MIKVKLGHLVVEFQDKFSKPLIEGKFKKPLEELANKVNVLMLNKQFEKELSKILHKGRAFRYDQT